MASAGAIVVASAAEAIDIATAPAYLSLAAIVAALNNNMQNIACMINTMQYFAFIPI